MPDIDYKKYILTFKSLYFVTYGHNLIIKYPIEISYVLHPGTDVNYDC